VRQITVFQRWLQRYGGPLISLERLPEDRNWLCRLITRQISHVFGPRSSKMFMVASPKFWDWDNYTAHTSHHVANFHCDRPTELGDLATKNENICSKTLRLPGFTNVRTALKTSSEKTTAVSKTKHHRWCLVASQSNADVGTHWGSAYAGSGERNSC